MAILITGVAGFIGSNLANTFINTGKIVFGIDNLCRGSIDNLINLPKEKFLFDNVDLSNYDNYEISIFNFLQNERIEEVWHFAANSDIQAGIFDPEIDFRDTFLTTYNTLRIMKKFEIQKIFFASSSAVYGDMGNDLIHEYSGPLLPVSNYGAMKLSSESIISAASESLPISGYIFRFPNVVGGPATHGIILDLVRKLKKTPYELNVLGDGTQQKAYLHVDELIDAMLYIRNYAVDKLNYYNIGTDDGGVSVRFIAEKIVELFSPVAQIVFGLGNKGWVGDVPKFKYSIEKVKALGWSPKLNSSEAIVKAIKEIIKQETE
jgi:UDP-glucose 4-epimerase